MNIAGRIFAIFLLFVGVSSHARIYVPIDQPADKKLPIAITDVVSLGGAGKSAEEITNVIKNDLEISAYFQIIPPGAFLEPKGSSALTAETINFDHWTAIEAQALVKGSIRKEGNSVVAELRLFDPFLKQMLVGKQYTGGVQNVRTMGHRFADEVMLALTGVLGPFNSKITYTAITGKGNKAIFVMDYDGAGNYAITKAKGLSLGSKFSPDGSKVVFTSYATGRPEIYMASLGGGTRQLTHNRATNIAPAFGPGGGSIIFSSSMRGDPDIFTMTTSGKLLGQLTNIPGVDISAVYSPDGGRILFSSERAGNLHVYTMDTSGGNASRLTFVGRFNDTPVWSPDGQKIAFCAQDSGAFDIFTMNADGSFIQRLTAGEGSNTHPSWSADSRYLTFASTRGGGEGIYVMRFDGANPVRVSRGGGQLPWWGPRLE